MAFSTIRALPPTVWSGTATTIFTRPWPTPPPPGLRRKRGQLFHARHRGKDGNVPLEAMVLEYASLRGSLDGMDTTVITEIADYYRDVIGFDIPPMTP